VIKARRNIKFVFVGKDLMNGKIQNLIESYNLQDHVNYLGFRENVAEIYQTGSIFVLPSIYGEGCPTSILEANSYKLPVLAYDIDGISELISPGKNGLLAQPGNIKDFQNKLIRLIDEPQLAKEMGNTGFKMVKENFNFDKPVALLNKYFLSL